MLPNPISYHCYRGDVLPPPTYYSYVLAGQGLFKWAISPHFEARIMIAPCRVAGLPDWPVPSPMTVPLIPAKWLRSVIAHAQGKGAIEQMYHFHYFKANGWRVSLPAQSADPGRVGYAGAAEPSIVMDLHSHHSMSAYFSATDNRDEQGCRFYGVIGNIFDCPEIDLRLGVWGHYRSISIRTIFEDAGPIQMTAMREVL